MMEIKIKKKWNPIIKDKKRYRPKWYTLKESIAHLIGLQEANLRN